MCNEIPSLLDRFLVPLLLEEAVVVVVVGAEVDVLIACLYFSKSWATFSLIAPGGAGAGASTACLLCTFLPPGLVGFTLTVSKTSSSSSR